MWKFVFISVLHKTEAIFFKKVSKHNCEQSVITEWCYVIKDGFSCLSKVTLIKHSDGSRRPGKYWHGEFDCICEIIHDFNASNMFPFQVYEFSGKKKKTTSFEHINIFFLQYLFIYFSKFMCFHDTFFFLVFPVLFLYNSTACWVLSLTYYTSKYFHRRSRCCCLSHLMFDDKMTEHTIK